MLRRAGGGSILPDGDRGWDVGARLDLVYGSDHPFAAFDELREPDLR